MAGVAGYDRIKVEVLALLARVPAGRIATHGAIGRHLGVDPRHIVNVMTGLDDAERATAPWWRVVADGGAVGRHGLRAEQMAKLRAEGVPVAPVGIAMELDARAMRSFDEPAKAAAPSPTGASAAPSRSRGMKSHPVSSTSSQPSKR